MEEYEQPFDDNNTLQSNLSLPPLKLEPSFEESLKPTKRIDYELVEKLINATREIDLMIKKKIEITEQLDITLSIITYKVYDATYNFKTKINAIKEERNKLLSSAEHRSELSLILHDLDEKISDLNKELELKVNSYNQKKIGFQERIENTISQLDEDTLTMEKHLQNLKFLLDSDQSSVLSSQIMIINEKYIPIIQQLEKNLRSHQRLQVTGWKLECSEVKITEILEGFGLKFTPSGKLLTKHGSRITFEEAQQKGYLKEVDISLEKVFEFFRDHDQKHENQEPTVVPDNATYNSNGISLTDSKMSSEDVKYLKEYVGKPLTLALAEITAKQPRDPIHYLAHYLFKYRYNQELAEVQKKELNELTKERKILAEQRWKRFVEEEARAAVVDMVIKAEEIAYQNALRRIEQEQLLAEEELEAQENEYENTLIEEAKDKFE